MSRADRLTPRNKTTEYYSDFLINLDRNPISGELARVTNERAVIRAMKGLLLTSQYERPFEPTINSRINSLLFEFNDDVTTDLLEEAIRSTIKQHERRVILLRVDCDARPDDESYYVTITFAMVNAPSEALSFSTVLKRVR